MTFGSIDDASTLISSLPANDAAHRQIEEQELRKVEEQLKGEAEHTEIEWADAEEWKETEEWVTREVTGCMEADERTTWEEGGCKEADESAAREAHEAEERKKGHLRMEEEHAQREVEDKIQWEQEWGCKVREEAVRATDDAEATSTLAHAISDAKLDPPEEVGVEDGANKVQQTDTVEETSAKLRLCHHLCPSRQSCPRSSWRSPSASALLSLFQKSRETILDHAIFKPPLPAAVPLLFLPHLPLHGTSKTSTALLTLKVSKARRLNSMSMLRRASFGT